MQFFALTVFIMTAVITGTSQTHTRYCDLPSKNVAWSRVQDGVQTLGGRSEHPTTLQTLQDAILHAGTEQSLQVKMEEKYVKGEFVSNALLKVRTVIMYSI